MSDLARTFIILFGFILIIASIAALMAILGDHVRQMNQPDTKKRIRYIRKMDREAKKLEDEANTAITGIMAGLLLDDALKKKDEKKDGDKPWYA
jgi:hypothetical protein